MWHTDKNLDIAHASIAAENIIPAHTRTAIPAEITPTVTLVAPAGKPRQIVCNYCNRYECEIFHAGYPYAEDGDMMCWYCMAQALIDHAIFAGEIHSMDG